MKQKKINKMNKKKKIMKMNPKLMVIFLIQIKKNGLLKNVECNYQKKNIFTYKDL